MTTSGTCVISFAGTRLAISWEGATSFALLNALSLTQSALAAGNGVNSHFRLISAEAGEPMRLYRGDHLLYRGQSEGAAAGILLDCTVTDLVDGCRIGPMFHTAAVSCCGHGILLPGKSGSGKTTLAAWLASKGWDYLSDEIACIEQGSMEVQAFYRSLHLRLPIAPPLERLIPAVEKCGDSPAGPRLYCGPQGVIVPIELINPHNTYHTPELQMIIFPHYAPDADGEFIRLSQAQACARMMGCAVNVRNLPGHGLIEISRLARRVPAYALIYGRLDHLADEMATLLDRHLPLLRAR
jgi:hypothetical protein